MLAGFWVAEGCWNRGVVGCKGRILVEGIGDQFDICMGFGGGWTAN